MYKAWSKKYKPSLFLSSQTVHCFCSASTVKCHQDFSPSGLLLLLIALWATATGHLASTGLGLFQLHQQDYSILLWSQIGFPFTGSLGHCECFLVLFCMSCISILSGYTTAVFDSLFLFYWLGFDYIFFLTYILSCLWGPVWSRKAEYKYSRGNNIAHPGWAMGVTDWFNSFPSPLPSSNWWLEVQEAM